jgi:hypothetical protein
MQSQLRDGGDVTARPELQEPGRDTQMQVARPGHAWSWTRVGAPVAVGLAVAGIAAGIAVAAAAGGSSQHPSGVTHRSAGAAAPSLRASGSPTIGKPYSFRLLIHCGVPTVGFGGRAWSPVQPVPKYPGARAVNGIVTETGYVVGTMTLVKPNILRFVADPRTVTAPFAVVFKPATVPSEGQVCA